MKSFLCAMLLAVVIIIGSSIYSHALENTIEDLQNHTNTIKIQAENQDWENCKPATEDLLARWSETQSWLMTVVGHREINRIEEILSEITGYTNTENQEEILVKIGVLEMLLNQILVNEEVSLTNIL